MSVNDECGLLHTEADTFDDRKNIACAMKTMRINLAKYGYIGTGRNKGISHYWQPLQDDPKKNRDQTKANKKAILAYTNSLPYCRIQAQHL